MISDGYVCPQCAQWVGNMQVHGIGFGCIPSWWPPVPIVPMIPPIHVPAPSVALCPVCNGTGKYWADPDQKSRECLSRECHGCRGLGWVRV